MPNIYLTATNEANPQAELTVRCAGGEAWMVWKGIGGFWLASGYLTPDHIPTAYLHLCQYRYWQNGAWREFSPERARAGIARETRRQALRKSDASVAPAPPTE